MIIQALIELDVDGSEGYDTVMAIMKFLAKQRGQKMELQLEPGRNDIIVMAKNAAETAFAVVKVR